ncbi:hypothetical protein Ancab_028123 [Ancistrocladus abbreviatus]
MDITSGCTTAFMYSEVQQDYRMKSVTFGREKQLSKNRNSLNFLLWLLASARRQAELYSRRAKTEPMTALSGAKTELI